LDAKEKRRIWNKREQGEKRKEENGWRASEVAGATRGKTGKGSQGIAIPGQCLWPLEGEALS
jgi:hypothetical protein